MREFNEDTLTEAVLARFSGTPDPRFKKIVTAEELDRVKTRLIADAVYQDQRKPFSNDDFDRHVSFLIGYAAARSAFVSREVGVAASHAASNRH